MFYGTEKQIFNKDDNNQTYYHLYCMEGVKWGYLRDITPHV